MKKLIFLLSLVSLTMSAQSTREQLNLQKMELDSLKQIIAQLTTDTDQDGVSDYLDKCSETPLGARIEGSGCALDTDLDGIIDLYDDCVTVPGLEELKGCPEVVICDPFPESNPPNNIEFEFLESSISDYNKRVIENVINIILKYGQGMTFLLSGHSSDYKSEKKNVSLGQERVQAVYDYMKEKAPGIEKQLEIKSVGSSDLLYPECAKPKNCKKLGDDWKNRANNRVSIKVLASEIQ